METILMWNAPDNVNSCASWNINLGSIKERPLNICSSSAFNSYSRSSPGVVFTMKLYYFNLKGRAETARLMLRVGRVHFEDIVYSGEEWRAKYKALSPSGKVCSTSVCAVQA
jgi:hypothetical protein